MTVQELIELLQKMPQDKKVNIGTIDMACGEVVRVYEENKTVEIESNRTLM